MTRVVFVDDERAVVDALRRQLRPMRDEWEMEFATDAAEAVAKLSEAPTDALVTDIRMPGLDGVELLRIARRDFPQTARFVLSGHTSQSSSLQLTGLAHQFLVKPCEPDELRAVVNRALELRRKVSSPSLVRLVSGLDRLPAVPSLYSQVVSLVTDPDTSLQDVGEVIEQDTAMSAKVLQLVNSSFFGLRHRVTSPTLAVTLLGINTVMALVLGIQVFSTVTSPSVAGHAERIHRTSLAVAAAAREIATAEGMPRDDVSDYYLAGMMHDVGLLTLLSSLPERTLGVIDAPDLIEAERSEFGTTHQEVGAYLLGLWGLPDDIVEAAAFHHDPSASPTRRMSPLAVTHVAGAVARALEDGENEGGEHRRPLEVPLDHVFIAESGLEDKAGHWADVARQIIQDV